ncbi:MAG: SH3 domain-containing protein [Devosia sp.]|uniref:SH3 domain-containing protein n=1 Tax=Devosia sp. TaxID=1871048 RepID=UPI0024C562DF|nr:SH3 domain-containing protein [Devosia sp.]UYO00985.1 MAG: SH3 domain-containing protein [Devosia sp.]
MSVKRITLGTAVALVSIISTSAAWAVPGVATGNVNVRTGPGTGYAKVGTLSTGEAVDVKQCQGNWCFVDRSGGTDGWVSKNYLAATSGGGGGGSSSSDIPFNFGVTVGPGGPSFSFGIGDAPPPPPPPAPTPKVCFWKNSNFTGAQFCVAAGVNEPAIAGGWNNSISSIRVYGGAQVTVCTNAWYAGSCATVSTDRPNLGFYNNTITSYQTF